MNDAGLYDSVVVVVVVLFQRVSARMGLFIVQNSAFLPARFCARCFFLPISITFLCFREEEKKPATRDNLVILARCAVVSSMSKK